MMYKVLTMIAAMLAVAAGMPVDQRLALLEAKVGVLKEALADKVSADDVDEQVEVTDKQMNLALGIGIPAILLGLIAAPIGPLGIGLLGS